MAESSKKNIRNLVSRIEGANEGDKRFKQIESSIIQPWSQKKAQLESNLRASTDPNEQFRLKQQLNEHNRMLSTRQAQVNAEAKRQGVDAMRKQDADRISGAKFGAAILGDEGLGRLGEDKDVQEVMSRYKSIADEGLSREEVAAEKSKMYNEIQSSGEASRRNLQAALARAGVKGGMAGRQLGENVLATQQQKANVSRDLFLRSEAMKREGLKDYSSRLGQLKTFDLGQAAQEKNLIMQSAFGFSQGGIAERTGQKQAEFAAAQRAASSGGK